MIDIYSVCAGSTGHLKFDRVVHDIFYFKNSCQFDHASSKNGIKAKISVKSVHHIQCSTFSTQETHLFSCYAEGSLQLVSVCF